ncbi:MAG: ATP synthase subunit I [Rhodocyclaceae bacterium]|nr:ATP synthase subunit I [Rhodocyclaceae bacterium]
MFQSADQDLAPDSDGLEDENFKVLTAEEAKALQKSSPRLSPWVVVMAQVVVGALVAGLTGLLVGSGFAFWSAAYGVLAVVVPAAVFARGLARQQRAPNAGSALGGFFVWEMVKVVLTVAMLFAAPRLVVGLNWLALLAGFVVTMKVYWVAMWLHSKRAKSVAKI